MRRREGHVDWESRPEVGGALDLRGRSSLREAAGLIAAADCFVGIESGPTCIAAALQAPAVGLFGRAYIPRCEAIQPRNPNATYLSAETLGGIDADLVIEAVRRKLQEATA